MRRNFTLALMGGLLLLGGVGAMTPAPATFSALFCPECWEYLWGPGSVDMRGNCGACGKYPVDLEAQRMSWRWCEGEKKWLKGPCDENRVKRCCTREEAFAAVVAPGPEVLDRSYCPAHRAFAVYRLPIVMLDLCRTCARPAVKVNAVERTWTWCEIDGAWTPEACPMSPVRNCCTERKGLLLARLDPGPVAK